MRHPTCLWLSGLSLAAILIAPSLAPAQTPESAAGNPAINGGTPAPGGTRSPMASPSSEAQIPKGSNPDSGRGNLSPGSGATPPAQASGNSSPNMMPQTANNPDSGSGTMGTNTNGSKSPEDTMPQGKYAAPPTSPSRQ